MALIIIGVMWFFYADAIQSVQTAFNEQLSSDRFATPGNWNSFNLANNFVIALITFFLVFLVIGLGYYGYIEAQRRS